MDRRHQNVFDKAFEEPAPPGIPEAEYKPTGTPPKPVETVKTVVSSKGIENAKKRLRAFSIQKRTPLAPAPSPKPSGSGTSAVFIGRLNSIKPSRFAPIEDDPKKPPRPPKLGSGRKFLQDSYSANQRKTLEEIEDMKRKMELVDLGIPLGLICPGIVDDRAMPTKAMPPIKSLLDPAKVDEIIRAAKKARQEGKEYKFDYQKLLPDYDNPFQRKRDENEEKKEKSDVKAKDKESKKREYHHESKNYSEYEDKQIGKSKDIKDASRNKESKSKDREEVDANLKDYLVCDSWSLDEKNNSSSPKPVDKLKMHPGKLKIDQTQRGFDDIHKVRGVRSLETKEYSPSAKSKDSHLSLLTKGKNIPLVSPKVKLQPVIDSFKFEIDDPQDDEVIDNYDIEDIPLPPKKDNSGKTKIFEDVDDTPSGDEMDDDTFMESVINEMKGDNIDDEFTHEKSLVEYDISPSKDDDSKDFPDGSVTPELDDSMRELHSSRHSNYSDGYRSTESGYKSTESGYKSTESGYKTTASGYKSIETAYKSTESGLKSTDSTYKCTESTYKSTDTVYKPSSKAPKDDKKKSDKKKKSKEKTTKSPESDDRSNRVSLEKEDDMNSMKMSKYTLESLETWSFVLKFCQPLLFRHDKTRCYKETRSAPKLWFAEAPKYCACVDERQVVYAELQEFKMSLVDRVYGCDQISDAPFPTTRSWYPRSHLCLLESTTVPIASEWEEDCVEVKGQFEVKQDKFDLDLSKDEKGQVRRSMTPLLNEDISVDLEYRRFMEAVWPSVVDSKPPTPRGTPPAPLTNEGVIEPGGAQKSSAPDVVDVRKTKKIKLCSDGWSQESELDEEPAAKKLKKEKKDKIRKRKHSPSKSDTGSEDAPKKKKKSNKKKIKKKLKSKLAKRRRTEKKRLKKLKEKQKKKKSSDDVEEKEIKKEHKKSKKKKQLKLKKKDQKKKKSKKVSSSSDNSSSTSSSESSSESESSSSKTKKTKKEQKQKNKDKKRKQSTSEFTESDTDIFDANILNNIKQEQTDDERSAKKIHREIINVKELQNDFVGKTIQIKQEDAESNQETEMPPPLDPSPQVEHPEIIPNILDIPLPQKIPVLDENLSQSSSQASQESVCSVKEFEKDESHLRPSSQNSNYSFNDVIASRSGLYNKSIESEGDCEKFGENYEPENYDVYEQMALEYQNDVANQQLSCSSPGIEQKIETVVRRRGGEIKCDWRAADQGAPPGGASCGGAAVGGVEPRRPSRWGLKPGEVNIVLTGGGEQHYKQNTEPVYQIESLANRNTDNNSMSYDEAYMHTYGASDKLQYGDCFAEVSMTSPPRDVTEPAARYSLDDRIDQALRNSVLGEVARDPDDDKENKDKNKNSNKQARCKSVSFADGYKPGQDSDVEEPPKRKKRAGRRGCAWPCPASHPDHVPLWDALPPPPPPAEPYPHLPPPQLRMPPPLSMLAPRMPPPLNQLKQMLPPHHGPIKYEPTVPGFMPPEPPPGLIKFN